MTTDASDLFLHVSTRTWVGLVTTAVVVVAAAAGAGGAVYLGWWGGESASASGEGGTLSSLPSKSKVGSTSKAKVKSPNEVVGTTTTAAPATKKKRRRTKGQRFREDEDGGKDGGTETQEPGVSVPGGFDVAAAAGGEDARIQTAHEGLDEGESKDRSKNKNKNKAKSKRQRRVHESWPEDEDEGEKENEGAAGGATTTGDPALPAKTPVDTDSSWTHVKTSSGLSHTATTGAAAGHVVDQAEVPSSDADDTTSSEQDSETSLDSILMALRDGRPLSTRHAARRARRLSIMRRQAREKEDRLRVIRVQPPPGEPPVPGFSWEDYGDVVEDGVHAHDADAEDEGEWGVVKGRHRTRQTMPTTTTTSSTSGVTLQAAPASATEHKTKKQRQNARKRELAKAAKTSVEADRLQGLAEHKRELERRRIVEQSRQGGGKQPSGGMQAKVDEHGKLVWE